MNRPDDHVVGHGVDADTQAAIDRHIEAVRQLAAARAELAARRQEGGDVGAAERAVRLAAAVERLAAAQATERRRSEPPAPHAALD